MEKKKVAIIGSGISGIFLAWLLERSGFRVSLIEKLPQIGMDAHGLELEIDGVRSKIDVPLRVFNPKNWKHLDRLIHYLGLSSNVIDVSHSVSDIRGETIFCYHQLRLGNSLLPYFNRFKYLNRDVLKVFSEIIYFILRTKSGNERLLLERDFDTYLSSLGLSDKFKYKYVYPVLQTICTCSLETVKAYPAAIIIASLQNIIGYNLRRIDGGTQSIVSKLTSGLSGVMTSTSANSLSIEKDQVRIKTNEEKALNFDHVVFATQANQTAKILPAAFEREKSVMADFPYDNVDIYVHKDQRFMPKNQGDWVPLNFMVPDEPGSAMSTTWMNLFEEELRGKTPVLQTIDPVFMPRDEDIFAEIHIQRAVVDSRHNSAFSRLNELHKEKGRRVWFCGSYANDSLPLLESGIISSMRVARHLGAEIPAELADSSF